MAAPGLITIEFPEAIRSRKVVTRSRARPTGKFPSWKMGRMLQWESINELHAFRLLDCNPNVTGFREQPCEIAYVHDGVIRSHFPDILVEVDGLKEIWEVKPRSEALRPEISSRSALLAKHLPAWGYSYHVVLGDDLAKQPRLGNANLLLSFGRRIVTDCEQEFIRLALEKHGSLHWSDACAGAYGAKGREILCHLVLTGILTFDINSPCSPSSQFFPRKGGI